MKNILLAFVLISLTACGGSKKKSYPFNAADLGIKVNESSLNGFNSLVYKDLKSGKEASNEKYLNALIEMQRSYFKASSKNDNTLSGLDLKKLYSEELVTTNSSDIFTLKINLEKNLNNKTGLDLDYNVDAVNLFSSFNGEMQCYSGTLSLEVARRSTGDMKAYEKTHPVMIFESGHILPGFMEKVEDAWHLVGAESTVAGRGEKKYGDVKTLKRVRVIAAPYFVALEIFKFVTTNMQQTFEKALLETAEYYGIPLTTLETTIDNPLLTLGTQRFTTLSVIAENIAENSKDQNVADHINIASPQFGRNYDIESGKRKRKVMNEVPLDNIGTELYASPVGRSGGGVSDEDGEDKQDVENKDTSKKEKDNANEEETLPAVPEGSNDDNSNNIDSSNLDPYLSSLIDESGMTKDEFLNVTDQLMIGPKNLQSISIFEEAKLNELIALSNEITANNDVASLSQVIDQLNPKVLDHFITNRFNSDNKYGLNGDSPVVVLAYLISTSMTDGEEPNSEALGAQTFLKNNSYKCERFKRIKGVDISGIIHCKKGINSINDLIFPVVKDGDKTRTIDESLMDQTGLNQNQFISLIDALGISPEHPSSLNLKESSIIDELLTLAGAYQSSQNIDNIQVVIDQLSGEELIGLEYLNHIIRSSNNFEFFPVANLAFLIKMSKLGSKYGFDEANSFLNDHNYNCEYDKDNFVFCDKNTIEENNTGKEPPESEVFGAHEESVTELEQTKEAIKHGGDLQEVIPNESEDNEESNSLEFNPPFIKINKEKTDFYDIKINHEESINESDLNGTQIDEEEKTVPEDVINSNGITNFEVENKIF